MKTAFKPKTECHRLLLTGQTMFTKSKIGFGIQEKNMSAAFFPSISKVECSFEMLGKNATWLGKHRFLTMMFTLYNPLTDRHSHSSDDRTEKDVVD